ncbi:MAG: DHHA1 domain-containing protein, partial [Gammaproteobacteria bacterium]|nr:DHHA1 domain-containing protein [Gammaproteobacteria bacterium]
ASDLGFVVGPRLNAAGRLTDMSLGIECLLTDDPVRALEIARQLHDLNRERRQIQQDMESTALETIGEDLDPDDDSLSAGICLYDPGWHQGVVGILASRIKERVHRPVIVFAPDRDGIIKGSGRSISGIHIRDVLEAIAARHPSMIEKFGGHAMAAGLTLREAVLPEFQDEFNAEIMKQADPDQLRGTVVTDGSLQAEDINLPLARAIRAGGPWGQGFPEPLFRGEFEILDRRIVGEHHLRLTLRPDGSRMSVAAIAFNTTDRDWPDDSSRLFAAYRLDVNEFNGRTSAQLCLEHIELC